MSKDTLTLVFITLAGAFSMAGGIFDWNWFMNNRRAWLFVKLFGRGGARVVYVLLGLALLLWGGYSLLGALLAP